jgi:uncharacterized protein with HEPN domain
MSNDKRRIIRPEDEKNKPAPIEFRDMSDRQYNARLSAVEMSVQRNEDQKRDVRTLEIQVERHRLVINQLSEQLTSVVEQTQKLLNDLRAEVTQLKWNQELQARTLVTHGVLTEEQFKAIHTTLLDEITAAMEANAKKKQETTSDAAAEQPIQGDGTGTPLPDFDPTTERIGEPVGEPTSETSPEGTHEGHADPAVGSVGQSDDGPVRI